ncbi:MAG: alpha-2-macroglobulin family protein [Nannocystaceae bacterium]
MGLRRTRARSLGLALAGLVALTCRGSGAPAPALDQATLLPGFDPEALVEGGPLQLGEAPPLAVLDLAPEGPGAQEPVRLRFNQALVDPRRPPADVRLRVHLAEGDPAAPSGWRELAGESRWTAPDTLTWTGERDLPRASAFRVSLDGAVRGPRGVVEGIAWRFETPRPTVETEWTEYSEPVAADAPVFLAVDPPASAEALAAHLRASAPGRREAIATRVRPATAKELDALDEGEWIAVTSPRGWPRGVEVTLTIDAGLRSAEGPLSLGEPVEASFKTLDRLRVRAVTCGFEPGEICEDGPIELVLSTELDDAEARRVIVHPRPADLEIEASARDEAPTLQLSGAFEAGVTYRITLPADLEDRHGQRLGRREVHTVRFAAPMRSDRATLSLSDPRGVFWRAEDARIGVISEHVTAATRRVTRLDDAGLVQALQSPTFAAIPWPRSEPAAALPLAPSGRDLESRRALDLMDHGGRGDALLVEVEAADLSAVGASAGPPAPARGLYQISALAADAHLGPARGVVQVFDAGEGRPRRGATATLHTAAGARDLGETDRHGLVALPGADALGDGAVVVIHDAAARDRLALALGRYPWENASERTWMHERGDPAPGRPPRGLQRGEQALVSVHVGQGVHLPGDTLHIAGWAAVATPHAETSTRPVPPKTSAVIELRRHNEVIMRRRAPVSAHGRFVASVRLPSWLGPNRYQIHAEVLGGEGVTLFELADVRVPAFEVSAVATPSAVIRGETAELRVQARYLSGEPAPIDSLRALIDCYPTRFRPEGVDSAWTVGPSSEHVSASREEALEPRLTSSELRVPLRTDMVPAEVPHRCTVDAAVLDRALQEVGGRDHFLVHPARAYLAIQAPTRSTAGSRVTVPVQAFDLEGRRVALRGAQVEVFHIAADTRALATTCSVDLTATGPESTCSVDVAPGDYYVHVHGAFEGAPIAADAHFFVDAADPSRADAEGPRAPTTDARPARPLALKGPEVLTAGEPAWIEIEAPWDAGEGLLEVIHTGLREVLPFTLERGAARIQVIPRPGRGPALTLQTTVVRPAAGAQLPARHTAELRAKVREARDLVVEVTSPTRASPGQKVPVGFTVVDSEGAAVDARLAVWVIDDGIHQLRRPFPAWLRETFDPKRHEDPVNRSSYDQLLAPWSPDRFARRHARVPHVRVARAEVQGSRDVRQRFDSAPLFVGDLGVGADGHAELQLQLPDDLTRFRITAIASAPLSSAAGARSAPARFGEGEATVEVHAPMMVRAALPRVLRPGDVAEIAALVTIPEGRGGTLVVDAAVGGGIELVGPSRAEERVRTPGPHRLTFKIKARAAGEPAITLKATLRPDHGAPLSSGVREVLPVAIDRTQIEHAAHYGSFDADEPVAIPVRIPGDLRPDHGGLSVTVQSAATGDLEDAAAYLIEYPYGCLEQTASRLLPLIAVKDLADRVTGSGEAAAMADAAVARILSMQRRDGGFAPWPDVDEPAPFAGAYATWMLGLAVDAGIEVPQERLARARRWLAERATAPLPASSAARLDAWIERALALHVLASAGEAPPEALTALYERRGALPIFARTLLLMAIHRVDPGDPRVTILARQLSAAIDVLPEVAHVVDPGAAYPAHYDSPARTDAMALLALLQIDPADPRIEGLARGLAQSRAAGRWRNTQENAWALLGLARAPLDRPARPRRLDPYRRGADGGAPAPDRPRSLRPRDPRSRRPRPRVLPPRHDLGRPRRRPAAQPGADGPARAPWRAGARRARRPRRRSSLRARRHRRGPRAAPPRRHRGAAPRRPRGDRPPPRRRPGGPGPAEPPRALDPPPGAPRRSRPPLRRSAPAGRDDPHGPGPRHDPRSIHAPRGRRRGDVLARGPRPLARGGPHHRAPVSVRRDLVRADKTDASDGSGARTHRVRSRAPWSERAELRRGLPRRAPGARDGPTGGPRISREPEGLDDHHRVDPGARTWRAPPGPHHPKEAMLIRIHALPSPRACVLGAALLTLAACDTEVETTPSARVDEIIVDEIMPVATDAPSDEAMEESSLDDALASVALADGTTIHFIELDDGEIALLEARDPANPSTIQEMIREHDATPLEIYLASDGDDVDVIARLEEHHRTIRSTDRRPLTLPPMIPRSAHSLELNGFHDIHLYCDQISWPTVWANDLNPVSQVHASGFRTQEQDNDNVTFYPGGDYNTKTWLGVCAADYGPGCSSNAYDDRIFSVERLVSGAWSNVLTVMVDAKVWGTGCNAGYEKSAYTFYSFNVSGARFRGKLGPYWGSVCPSCYSESFGFAVAYDPVIGL